MIKMTKIPVVRITSKLFSTSSTDFRMEDFDNKSVDAAKQIFINMLMDGLPRNKISVRHTQEIVWVDENELK